MNAEDFIVFRRPRLAAVSNFPEIAIPDYERRLKPMQKTLQLQRLGIRCGRFLVVNVDVAVDDDVAAVS